MRMRWGYVLLGMMITGVPGSTYAIFAGSTEPEVLSESVSVPRPSLTPEPTLVVAVTPTIEPTPTVGPTATPDPGPTTTPDVWSPVELEPLFTKYANEYGVDKNVLERIANCESHFNPNASYGPYLGMFQFDITTWQKYRGMMGWDADPDLRTNIEESIKTAAFALQQSGIGLWPSCL